LNATLVFDNKVVAFFVAASYFHAGLIRHLQMMREGSLIKALEDVKI
jgi:hypothetical protein